MLSLSQRQAAVQMLAAEARPDGSVPSSVVHRVAAAFGVSPRQTHRYWAQHRAAATQLDAETEPANEVELLAGDAHVEPHDGPWWKHPTVLSTLAGTGTLKEAWEQLKDDAQVGVPGYVAFTRTFKKRTHSALYATVTRRGGREGYIGHSLFLNYTAPHRNAVWQADAQQIPVDVTTATGVQRIKPWQTTFIDDATRVVVATVITASQPTAADVVAAIAAGVRGTQLPDGTRIGSLPESIRWDNGKEFLNEAVNTACARLGISPQACAPFTPWEKGKIERWHLTSQSELYDRLPGATHGPSTFTGTQPWRNQLDRVLTLQELTLRALAWVQTYNCERHHEVLKTTPAAAWAADTTPLTFLDPAVLHQFSLAVPKERTVNRDGISVGGVKYLAAALGGIVRRKVQVRVLPHDNSVIAVFHDGKFVCEAYPAASLDHEERRSILAGRRDSYEEARVHVRAAAARRSQAARIAAEDAEVDAAAQQTPPARRDPNDWDIAPSDDAFLALIRDQHDGDTP
ncbi:Mu transposase C-terminal domain-containing protein [Pedococcus sp. NPDC057267]|uniref:Mu transposase C-terminal domain-containing protein n=1 Tax=Pedococcus sp. NPDC057267 TaxID=3346077 RepID=UPI00363D6B53